MSNREFDSFLRRSASPAPKGEEAAFEKLIAKIKEEDSYQGFFLSSFKNLKFLATVASSTAAALVLMISIYSSSGQVEEVLSLNDEFYSTELVVSSQYSIE